MDRKIPTSIKQFLGDRTYVLDDTGLSGSHIMIFDDVVLKIVPYHKDNEEIVRMMIWLEDKLSVPHVIRCERDRDSHYLLTSKVPGKMACDDAFLKDPQTLVSLLAEVMKTMWRIDVSNCPRDRSLEVRLCEARERVNHDLVDLSHVEPTTFTADGFKDPNDLLLWLESHKPLYEPVLSHGDFCLPNIMIADGHISGLIDLGNAGIADKWQDIALCYRSLKHNFDGTYGGQVYSDFDPNMLFDALGIARDHEKLTYYLLLDELF